MTMPAKLTWLAVTGVFRSARVAIAAQRVERDFSGLRPAAGVSFPIVPLPSRS
jgi:hypothetical protein